MNLFEIRPNMRWARAYWSMRVIRGMSRANATRLPFVATLGLLFALYSPSVLLAAVFHIDFWTDAQTTNIQDTTIRCQNMSNLKIITEPPFATGTFAVPDDFLGTPDGFLPFRSANFTISVLIDGLNFDLPGDDLRSVRVGDPEEEGLGVRLDVHGCVQRFDIPLFSTSNNDSIIDTDSTTSPQLVFWDRNPSGGESYFVETPDGLAMLSSGKAENLGLVSRPQNEFTVILPAGDLILQGLVHQWDGSRFPTVGGGIFRIRPSTPCDGARGDLDKDGDVDRDDYLLAIGCLAGPNVSVQGVCKAADVDGDIDVDLEDLHIFEPVIACLVTQ